MKIIELGELPQEVEYKLTCRSCQTVFMCTAGEMRRVDDMRDGHYWVVQCPLCKEDVTRAMRT